MSTRVAINGFGRIGRLYLRAALKRGADLEIAAVNDLTDAATLAHLMKYDSVHGIWPGEVSASEGELLVDGHHIKVLSASDISLLPWRELGVDVVLECTGRYTERAKAAAHLDRLLVLGIRSENVTDVLTAGDADPLNGASGLKNVRPQLAIARRAYKALAAGDRLRHDVFGGGHRWHGVKAIPWMKKWVGR